MGTTALAQAITTITRFKIYSNNSIQYLILIMSFYHLFNLKLMVKTFIYVNYNIFI